MRKIHYLLVFLFLFPGLVFADVVELNSGVKVEGKVVEQSNEYTRINVKGVVLTLYPDEISQTKLNPKPKIILSTPLGWDRLSENKLAKLSAERLGIAIKSPSGTISYTGKPLIEYLILISKYPYSSAQKNNILIFVTSENLEYKQINSTLDYAKSNFYDLRQTYPDAQLIEDFAETEINGFKGVSYNSLFTNEKKEKMKMQSHLFWFSHNMSGVNLTILADSAVFDENTAIYKELMDGFLIE